MFKKTHLAFAVALWLLGSASTARAADDDVQHAVSVTVSPFHLIMPVVEMTGEYRLTDDIGIALILGAGKVTVTSTSASGATSTEATGSVIEVGGQFRYYLVGSFIHGMQIGVETLYVHAAVESSSNSSVSGTGSGLEIAPFVGYKIATDIGFTFETQLGYGYMVAAANAEDSDTGESGSASDGKGLVLLNINLGWSF